jgi:hypothetical protein
VPRDAADEEDSAGGQNGNVGRGELGDGRSAALISLCRSPCGEVSNAAFES